MGPKIVAKAAFRMAGAHIRTNEEDNRRNRTIPAFWDRMNADGAFWERLRGIASGDAVLGASTDFDGKDFSYWIAMEVGADSELPAGLEERTIPAQTYAVFTARGRFPHCIWQTIDYIYNEWLRSNERTGGPDFEWYDSRFDRKTSSGEADIYIPVGG